MTQTTVYHAIYYNSKPQYGKNYNIKTKYDTQKLNRTDHHICNN